MWGIQTGNLSHSDFVVPLLYTKKSGMEERVGSDRNSVPDIWTVKYTQVCTFMYVCTRTSCTKTEEEEGGEIDDNGGKSPTTT